jgi:hypothetical protein
MVKILYVNFLAILVYFISGHLSLYCQTKHRHLPKKIHEEDISMFLDTTNRTSLVLAPKEYIIQAKIAAPKYEELDNKKIIFKRKNFKTTMATRPDPLFFIMHKSKRRYLILVNDQLSKINDIHFDSLSFNMQVGILGHEYAHIAYYTERKTLPLIWDGIRLINPKFKERFEKNTDIEAIKRGFGWQLYAFAKYIQSEAKVEEQYKAYKRKFYLEPHEILEYMKRYGYKVEY